MTNSDIRRILHEKDVNYLYHANTVCTAITYLENGGLLSRGTVEELGLVQTSQLSDEIDIELNVYYDIFFDSVDIHERAKKINNYGPVTFVYSTSMIDKLPEGVIRVTKTNPIYWNTSMSDTDKYFINSNEMWFSYQKGCFNQHFTILNQREPLSFDCLHKIILDDPHAVRGSDRIIFENAIEKIEKLLEDNNINVPLVIRECPDECQCSSQYNRFKEGYIYYKFGVDCM